MTPRRFLRKASYVIKKMKKLWCNDRFYDEMSGTVEQRVINIVLSEHSYILVSLSDSGALMSSSAIKIYPSVNVQHTINGFNL